MCREAEVISIVMNDLPVLHSRNTEWKSHIDNNTRTVTCYLLPSPARPQTTPLGGTPRHRRGEQYNHIPTTISPEEAKK
ncbi:hypothetical protein AVEN_163282-1, partial [Araneus ventricosus]